MKLYEGTRTDHACSITANGEPLPMRNDLRNHSPDGGEWAYHGSGPAQLALALLADATGNDEVAQQLYQRYKREIIANLDRDHWIITQAEIRSWVAYVLSTPEE